MPNCLSIIARENTNWINTYNAALLKLQTSLKQKFSGLYSSVPTSEETVDAIAENMNIDIQKYCSTKVNKDEIYVHCHVIGRDDVRDAVSKLNSSKIDKDVGFYSESIIHGTGLLLNT